MLNVKTEISGDALHIALEGLLDSQTVSDLKAVLHESFDKVNSIEFDFEKLEYLTSAGLRTILVAQQAMNEKKGVMTVKNVPKEVMDIFDMTGFSDVLTIV